MAVPLTFDPPVDGGVVVGYDGSADGLAALRWARDDARAHHQPLHVVRAWTVSGAMAEVGAPVGIVPSLDECAAAVRADTLAALDTLDAVVPDGAAAPAGPGGGQAPETHVHVVHGRPGEVLTAAARHADVLVVGHRGHRRLDLVLGSVTVHVLEHARCPVLVLPIR